MAKGKGTCADRLVACFGKDRGALVAAARALSTYHALVSNWKQQGYIPPSWALAVERATDGKVTVQEILEEYEKRFPKKAAASSYIAG